jgi:hypothetical protein
VCLGESESEPGVKVYLSKNKKGPD